MDTNERLEFYITVGLLLLGFLFSINYFESGHILDLIYGGLLIVYSLRLYNVEIKKIGT